MKKLIKNMKVHVENQDFLALIIILNLYTFSDKKKN